MYFELDRDDDFRRKGPCKEFRIDLIVGLCLLLDSNQIPIGMKMYPGNESEKPVMRDVISNLKKQNNITGRTIHVADKGLNCAQNIAISKSNGDGYLFSKSVKGLSAKEKQWVLLEQDFYEKKDKNGKVLYRYKSCIDKFPYDFYFELTKEDDEFLRSKFSTLKESLKNRKFAPKVFTESSKLHILFYRVSNSSLLYC